MLRLKTGKYYIGKSKDTTKRVDQHARSSELSCAFVIANGGVEKVLECETPPNDDLSTWERNETIHRMLLHGFDNVRGSMFTSEDLTAVDCEIIERLVIDTCDMCRRCGHSGHFVNSCSDPSKKAQWMINLRKVGSRCRLTVAELMKRAAENISDVDVAPAESKHDPPSEWRNARVKLVVAHPQKYSHKQSTVKKSAELGRRIRTPQIGDEGFVKAVKRRRNGTQVFTVCWDSPNIVVDWDKLRHEISRI